MSAAAAIVIIIISRGRIDSFEYPWFLPKLDLEQAAVLQIHGVEIDIVAHLVLVALVFLCESFLRPGQVVAQILMNQVDEVALPLPPFVLIACE